jgi:hypothetical protein
MPAACEEPLKKAGETIATNVQEVQSTVQTVSLPQVDLTLIGLFPVWAGWLIVGVFGLLLIIFVIGYAIKNSIITSYWSKFIWGSLVILLIALSSINGVFNSIIADKTKVVCNTAKDPTITIMTIILGLITLLMGYIIHFDFGQKLDVQTYILIMLHVNLFSSLLVLSYVILFKLEKTTK